MFYDGLENLDRVGVGERWLVLTDNPAAFETVYRELGPVASSKSVTPKIKTIFGSSIRFMHGNLLPDKFRGMSMHHVVLDGVKISDETRRILDACMFCTKPVDKPTCIPSPTMKLYEHIPPDWAAQCVSLSALSAEALAYLECGETAKALESLRRARCVMDGGPVFIFERPEPQTVEPNYLHALHCNADRKTPLFSKGCSCDKVVEVANEQFASH